MSNAKYDSIIVGAGIAGLTSAAYLAREGKKVLLIERNKECGGLVNSFSVDGFHFDAGVRALEDAGIIFPMLEDLGIDLEVVKSNVSVGVENDILDIKDLNSLNDYRDLLLRTYPDSQADIDKVLSSIKKVMKHMDVLYGIENPVFKDLKKDTQFIFKKLLPWLPKFIFTVGKINKMNMPVENYLKTIIKNDSLRDIISQHFFKHTPTFFALSYFSLYLDYFYPKGGVGRLAEVIQEKIIDWGGEIKTECTITRVNAYQKEVIDENNNAYRYNTLIWAGDLKTLYRNTNTEALPQKQINTFEATKVKMLERRGGESVFSLYLRVNVPLEEFRKIANGHFFYTPSKLGLGEVHGKDLYRLLSNWKACCKEDVYSWMEKYIQLNTFEISIPGLKYPELAPEGKTGMIISFLAEYDLFKKISETDWKDEFKSKLENQVIQVINDSIFPKLKENIIGHFSFSPISIENRTGSSEGAIIGWSFQEPVPVLNKIQHAGKSVLTPIPSIFQAGQWAYSPAGVPMSILTGKIASDKIIKLS